MTWAKQIKKPLFISLIVLVAGIILIAFNLNIHRQSSLGGILFFSFGVYAVIQILIFYRDPDRRSQALANMILSPAEGRVVAVEEIDEPHYFQGKALRVAIFMHIFNVHIQRMPIEAAFLWQKHFPGKYLPAFDNKAAKLNEQRLFAFEKDGRKIALYQIAGLLARRTNCWLTQEKQIVPRNTKIGMITLGSEIDLYLPIGTILSVKRGDKVVDGQSVIGEWNHGS